MAKSVAIRNAILDHIFGNAVWSAPADIHISLHTGDPGTTGANEAAGGNYARANTTPDTDWGAAADGVIANANDIDFPEGGDGDTITHFGIWTAASGGSFIRGGALVSSFVYGATVTPSFAAGALTCSET